jgi:hypothetical protein
MPAEVVHMSKSTDQNLADEIRAAIDHVADLLNKAKTRDFVVDFMVQEMDAGMGEKVGETKKEFRATTVIRKIVTL